jgi:Asp-tRNA(Asn)/Glu-tRNA(Gln) amidotransferase B subunit
VVVIKNISSNKSIKKEIETTIKRKLNTKKKNKRIVEEIK